MDSLHVLFSKMSRTLVLAVGLAIIALIAATDYLNGPGVSLSLFYLVPIFIVTWYAGQTSGMLASLLSAVTWSVDDIMKSYRYGHYSIPIWNIIMQFGLLIFVVIILSFLKKALENERDMAREDYLTKVANARFFYEIADAEMARMKRYAHPLTFAYLDIDNFKAVNDRMGHTVGDHLLSDLATIIKRGVRAVDTVARLGGDEFGILMPETGEEGADIVISRIRSSIADMARKGGWPITISIGAVTCLDNTCSIDELIKKADSLMYAVKSSGKNSVKMDIIKSQA
jgi:diguanylate cyclase (GGDEF)-like protein